MEPWSQVLEERTLSKCGNGYGALSQEAANAGGGRRAQWSGRLYADGTLEGLSSPVAALLPASQEQRCQTQCEQG